MQVKMPWGRDGELAVELPPHWQVLAQASPAGMPALADLTRAIHQALDQPEGLPALESLVPAAGAVALVVDDISRPTPAHLLAPPLVQRLLAAGVDPERIRLVFALGTHRAMTKSEMRSRVTPQVFDRIQCLNHDCRDAAGLVRLGKTRFGTEVGFNRVAAEAKLRILIGTIEPHPQAGFGGGLKNLLPGVAGAETIGHNHLLMPSPAQYHMIGTDPDANPMRQDIEEAAQMLPGQTFILNSVLNPQGEAARVVAGDPIAAHRQGLAAARQIYCVPIPRPADVILSNSHPMDLDLRQGVKAVANMPAAVKKGGVILGFFRCELGLDKMKLPATFPPMGLLRLLLRGLGSRGIYWLANHLPASVPVEERFIINYSLQMLKDYHLLIYSPNLVRDTGGKYRQMLYDDLPALLARADRLLGRRRAEVLVFPQGAVTVPALT
jgi:nickel-dependent lactate racemase